MKSVDRLWNQSNSNQRDAIFINMSRSQLALNRDYSLDQKALIGQRGLRLTWWHHIPQPGLKTDIYFDKPAYIIIVQ